MKINKKQLKILEKYFDYMDLEDKDNLYLETWTNGGVDMIIYLDNDKSLIDNLKDYLRNFDIGEEIDLYRESKQYREAFTIIESVEDFKNWQEHIKIVIEELEVK